MGPTITLYGREYPRSMPRYTQTLPELARWKRMREYLHAAMALCSAKDRAMYMMLLKCFALAESVLEGQRPLDLDTPDLPWLSTLDGRGS